MNKIDEMIRELCPEGVKRVKLGDVCKSICTGLNPRQNFILNEPGATNYYVTVKEIASNSLVFSENTDKITTEAYEIIQKRSHLEIGDILFSGIGTIGKVVYVDVPTENWNCSESVFLIKPNDCIYGKFLSYVLKSDMVVKQYESCASGAIMKGVRKATLESLEIPLPPLAIQQEIVSILDSFSSLQSKLEEELAVRQKQMEFYREKLLTFDKDDNSVKWMKVSEISTKICSGGTPNRSVERYFSGDILWLRTQEVDWNEIYDTKIKITEEAVANSSAKIIPSNCVIIAMYGATAGKACINKVPLTTNQACCNVAVNSQVAEYKYLYYYICSRYEHIKGLGEGSQNNINAQKIKEYPIPIPPLSRQQEIVSTLDTMSSLIDKLNEEIELRKKQYEYYREALLSF